MLKSTPMRCLTAMVAIILPATAAQAQSAHDHAGHSHAGDSHADHDHGAVSHVGHDHDPGGMAIAYRLSDWQARHFDDPAKASLHLAAVTKLGCETKESGHQGHTDVVYRSPQWRSLELATDQLAHQWEAWLKGSGFETIHGHASGHTVHRHDGHTHGPDAIEEVSLRMVNWNTAHLDGADRSTEFLALMKGFGCEVHAEQQAGHSDVSFRCPEWTNVEFGSHQAAQGWEDWLKRSGFEVRHVHQ